MLRALSLEECGHAELSWQVHAWIMRLLDDDERRIVRQAMRNAVEELGVPDELLSEEARVASGAPPIEAQRRLVGFLDQALFAA
jgi:hypothetical protein